MTRLSACYFCGTALDETLEDYYLIPQDPGDDPGPTLVTLCPPCHDKLDAILAAVGESLTEADDASGDDPSTDATPPEPSTKGASKDETDDVLVDPAPDDGSSTDPGEPTADASPNVVPDPRQSHESDASADPDESDAVGSDADDGGATDDEGAPEDDAGERSVVEGDHSISALEYNKVMRLLQNREFPVDREEIEIVAANAYQVARSDCAKVIDVAVDRGLIEEVDGQLRKPDGA